MHGTFNVAGDGVLMLSQAVRRLGRPSVAAAGLRDGSAAAVFPQARRADLISEHADFLAHGRGLDTTAMREMLGFEPAYTTAEAFDDVRRTAAARAHQRPDGSPISRSRSRLVIDRAVPHGRR